MSKDYLIIKSLSASVKNRAEPILKDLCFSVPQGQLVAIIGHNGSGKSTLFKCINQSLPYTGNISLNQEDLLPCNKKKLSQKVVTLSQTLSHNLFMPLSIYENFRLWLMGLKATTQPCSKEQMQHYLATFNNKFSTYFHQPVELLSGGEKQLLTLAFILKSPPHLLLLDEHTSALDRKTTKQIMDFTHNKIKQYNLTCIMVIHDIDLAIKYADRIISLKNGEIISDRINANTQHQPISNTSQDKVTVE